MEARLTHKYPSLLHASLKSVCSTKAIVTSEGSLTYGELKDETERMMTDWRFDSQRPVMIHAQPTLKVFIALHALNRLGITVALGRCSISEFTSEWVCEQGFEQWVCPNTSQSICANHDEQHASAAGLL